jgi:hypothetical protein
MSLTPEMVAMCRDAMLEAGIPKSVVDEITTTRDRDRDRLRRIRATRSLDERYGPFPDGLIEHEKRELYNKIVWHLIDEGIASVRETRGFGEVEFSLDITVVTPYGWTPPAKVDDSKPIRVRR